MYGRGVHCVLTSVFHACPIESKAPVNSANGLRGDRHIDRRQNNSTSSSLPSNTIDQGLSATRARPLDVMDSNESLIKPQSENHRVPRSLSYPRRVARYEKWLRDFLLEIKVNMSRHTSLFLSNFLQRTTHSMTHKKMKQKDLYITPL